jgi:hypothetical protein
VMLNEPELLAIGQHVIDDFHGHFSRRIVMKVVRECADLNPDAPADRVELAVRKRLHFRLQGEASLGV